MKSGWMKLVLPFVRRLKRDHQHRVHGYAHTDVCFVFMGGAGSVMDDPQLDPKLPVLILLNKQVRIIPYYPFQMKDRFLTIVNESCRTWPTRRRWSG